VFFTTIFYTKRHILTTHTTMFRW